MRVSPWQGQGSAEPMTRPRWMQGRSAEGAGIVGRMTRGGSSVGAVVTDRPQWP
jgi:hypothetical protein